MYALPRVEQERVYPAGSHSAGNAGSSSSGSPQTSLPPHQSTFPRLENDEQSPSLQEHQSSSNAARSDKRPVADTYPTNIPGHDVRTDEDVPHKRRRLTHHTAEITNGQNSSDIDRIDRASESEQTQMDLDSSASRTDVLLDISGVGDLPSAASETQQQLVDQGRMAIPSAANSSARLGSSTRTLSQDDDASPRQPKLDPLSSYTCPICFSPPSHATLTPCGHICCGDCLFTAVKSSIERAAFHGPVAERAKCPVCRAPIPGWDGRGGGVIGLKPRVSRMA
ncbi:hypothetical protein BDW22DRAFT_1352273 [Trametopsis cervina]|nr:hypothetical protein BDW22DRAFT_1352273 [Trametopsis cervina]